MKMIYEDDTPYTTVLFETYPYRMETKDLHTHNKTHGKNDEESSETPRVEHLDRSILLNYLANISQNLSPGSLQGYILQFLRITQDAVVSIDDVSGVTQLQLLASVI